ncbi:hypothetical protein [Clostridium novyi]|uniref:hypothetical protein n=1 Tax=Clostridium novyi TaxID=1542 RepID=UPI0004D55E4A|nr:hypothetical protein [Clostridium novyi]KEI08146.1 hypothetical protein Z958_p0026 [Clostridium novyi B str. NCTC 9691]
MQEYIKKIYDLLYSPIITPYNLLENAKLDNYKYVKYYKGKTGLVCEMKCSIEFEGEAIFYYHFDDKDSLSKIYMRQDGKRSILFDRSSELKNTKLQYLSMKNDVKNKAI